jgi:hypothetical protein
MNKQNICGHDSVDTIMRLHYLHFFIKLVCFYFVDYLMTVSIWQYTELQHDCQENLKKHLFQL